MQLKTFTWCVDAGATQDTKLRTNVTQFGDGYEQVSSFGINNARAAWQVAKTANLDEINAIYQFLMDHKGITPFIVTMKGETKTYRTDGNINKTQVSGAIWQISFNLKQVFVP